MDRVPFRHLAHFVVAPVRLGDIEAEFIVDSGIGLTLVAERVAMAAGCKPTGASFAGRRMSGQEVEVPLARLPSLGFGGYRWQEVEVAILDMAGAAGLEGVSGFLSLALFGSAGVTIDYPGGVILVEEPSSLARRAADGVSVPVEVERDGPSTVVYASLRLPGGGDPVRVEVDTGSDCLILDTRFAGHLGVDLQGAGVERVEGRDETGQAFTRYFTRLEGPVSLDGAPEIAQLHPDVMFQRIIHDGLLGTAFLRRFPLTFDLVDERMIFGPQVA